MLPKPARVRLARDFTHVMRRGRRVGRPTLVVHGALVGGSGPSDVTTAEPMSWRAGFIVNKAVGGAVVRHRVQRRLRAVTGTELAGLADAGLLPASSRFDVVVRALPPAGQATSAELSADLAPALRSVLHSCRRELGAP